MHSNGPPQAGSAVTQPVKWPSCYFGRGTVSPSVHRSLFRVGVPIPSETSRIISTLEPSLDPTDKTEGGLYTQCQQLVR